VRASDFLLENFGAGVLDRLSFDFDAMQEMKARLVYCALKGFLSVPRLVELRPHKYKLYANYHHGEITFDTEPRIKFAFSIPF